MLTSASALVLAGLLVAQQTDTTVIVPAGARLDVNTSGGEIVVESWDRNEIRVRASHGSRDEVRIETSGSVVRINTSRRMGFSGIVDYQITVPAAMDLQLGGMNTDIYVEGTRGQVRAATMSGDITVRGGTGQVSVEAVSGDIVVENAQATVRAQNVSGSVNLRHVSGQVDATSVSGSVILDNIESNNVNASSVSGRVFYDGSIAGNGRYSLATHSGSVTAAVPANLDATVTVALLSGSFSSSFEGLTTGAENRGRRQTFTVGSGSGMLELESFSGNIRLVRQGEVSPP